MNPEFGEIAERLRRSTVHVRSGRGGSGSGVVWRSDGTVVTNAHVVRSERIVVEAHDGTSRPAQLVASDRARDLAALRINAGDLVPATAGDSDNIRPGALVIAVGNPLGFSGALTRGVVYGIGQLPRAGPHRWIQAAIRLAPGNSGGPLADSQGRVIGINTMIYGGLGLAIPSSTVARFLRSERKPRLGITIRAVPYGSGTGLVVLEVEPGGAADRASLMMGDVLVGSEGRPFNSPDDLASALDDARGPVHIDFVRGDRSRKRTVTVRVQPESAAA